MLVCAATRPAVTTARETTMHANEPTASTPAERPTDKAQPTQPLLQVLVYADPTEPRDETATRPAPRASRWLTAQVEAG